MASRTPVNHRWPKALSELKSTVKAQAGDSSLHWFDPESGSHTNIGRSLRHQNSMQLAIQRTHELVDRNSGSGRSSIT
jgi:hypothetical protein